jgi:hypothetical protein
MLPTVDANVDSQGSNTKTAANPTGTYLDVILPVAQVSHLSWLETPPDQTTGASESWDYPLTQDATPKATATNLQVTNQRQFLGFLAAGLFALGGSALIAIIPEVIREHAERDLHLSRTTVTSRNGRPPGPHR